MTSDEYTTLMDFLATRFARMDAAFAAMDARLTRIEARQDAMEVRLTRSEVLWESMRDDLRRVAEGVVAVNERLDRFQAETRARFDAHERRFDGMEVRFDGMEARFDSLERDLGGVHIRFDRFAVDFGTVQFDHGARIEALERQRRRRGPGG